MMKMRHRHINHKSKTVPVNKYTAHWSMKVWEKEIALKSTLKMYILVFITKKQARNWERSKDRSTLMLLGADYLAQRQCSKGAAAPSMECYRSLWRFRETSPLLSGSYCNLFPFCQEAEAGTAATSQLPSSPPAKAPGKEFSHLKFWSFKVKHYKWFH